VPQPNYYYYYYYYYYYLKPYYWRIRTNAEVITKYKSQDIVNVIKIRRLEWLGHVIRMDETGCVKKGN
jgi:hypothetical protein